MTLQESAVESGVVDSYLQENDGYFTASKLKVYRANPEEYRLQYVDKIKIEKDRRYFVIGTAFDDLLTYRIEMWNNRQYFYEGEESQEVNPLVAMFLGLQVSIRNNESIHDDQQRIGKRLEKYYIEEGLVVASLKSELLSWDVDKRNGVCDAAIKDMKLFQLRALYYEWDGSKRIRLTPSEGRKIIGMYKEMLRQPRMDMHGRRGVQVPIETTYKTHKIRWKLDRFVICDKDGDRYLPSEVDDFIETEGPVAWKNMVKEKWMYGIIRDWKTSGNLESFEYDMYWNYDYVFSMSFYYVLALAKYGVRSEVFLDVVGKKEPHGSYVYRMKQAAMVKKIQEEVKPLMDDLVRAYEHNIREPIKPLTGEPVSREEMMKSDYYPYMAGSIQKDLVGLW